ncbi:MAG: Gfo/Idh/MocA family oxidoreductase [Planctomycetes bacterium]|nr:Gfo/Idh/MocA family oxidoreductase [Planctomycetota bacterium]
MATPPEKNQRADGQLYAPSSEGIVQKVCAPGEFPFAAAYLDHGHIYGMVNGLTEAGGTVRYVYDPDPQRVAAFRQRFPEAQPAASFDAILADPDIRLVACAAINNLRGGIGVQTMRAGKDYFADKPFFTTLSQVAEARRTVATTGRKYMGYFSERLHGECAVKAGELVQEGAIGRVVQVLGLGPHRINLPTRPAWFFDREQYGGILCDIGSHQIEQFLHFTGATDARVVQSQVANYTFKQYPTFQDFGEINLIGNNGAVGYFRIDWFTPDALEAWGDGRIFILGTKGYIELRKYTDVGGSQEPDTLILVNQTVNERMNLRGTVGFPFFGELILDCLSRTEQAMQQERVFRVSELAIEAQEKAVVIES